MEYSELIKKMTLEEKASLCVGGSYWKSKGIERLGIPEIVMSDGPHGLRFSKSDPTKLGLNDSETSTCFPSGATLANTWNRNLAYKMGKALGKEIARILVILAVIAAVVFYLKGNNWFKKIFEGDTEAKYEYVVKRFHFL